MDKEQKRRMAYRGFLGFDLVEQAKWCIEQSKAFEASHPQTGENQ